MRVVHAELKRRQKINCISDILSRRIEATVGAECAESPGSSTIPMERSISSTVSSESPSMIDDVGKSPWFFGHGASPTVDLTDRQTTQPIEFNDEFSKIRRISPANHISRRASDDFLSYESKQVMYFAHAIEESTGMQDCGTSCSRVKKSNAFDHNLNLLASDCEFINAPRFHNTATMHRISPEPGFQIAMNSTRPKSKSIEIKRSRESEDSAQMENSIERVYDWATWRMYHRITSARRSRMASVVPFLDYKPSVAIPSLPSEDSMAKTRRSEDSKSSGVSFIDYSDHGEVFELEI